MSAKVKSIIPMFVMFLRYSVNDNRIVSQMFDMGIDIHDNHDEHDSMMKTMD